MNWAMNSLVEEGAQRAVNTIRISVVSLWLRPSVWAIFSRIIFVAVLGALKKQQLKRSCLRSRQYFTNAFGLNVSTISEITALLVEHGFISKVQLRQVEEKWQQCMYKLDGIIWEKVKAVIIEYIKLINRVALRRHIVPKDIVFNTSLRKKSDFSYKFRDPPDEKAPWVTIYDRRPDLKPT